MKEIIIVLIFKVSVTLAAKAGSCPDSSSMFGICLEGCSSDYDCAGIHKYCSNGCGHTCQNPTTVKSNLCGPENGRWDFLTREGKHKCQRFSGHFPKLCLTCIKHLGLSTYNTSFPCLCFDPATKPGTCPRKSGFGTCVEMCSSDSDCFGAQKCCSNGCGHTCQIPTMLTCLNNGITYHAGDSFTSSDGCNTCGSNKGMVLCTLMACLGQTALFLNKTIV